LVRELMTTNVAARDIRRKRRVLICGSCVVSEYPEIFEKYCEGRVPLIVCLEREHMNMVGFKIASMVARVPLEEIVVLTVDGSPHCVQLHMTVEEVRRIVGELNVRHVVIEGGRDVEVDSKCVKIARYLTKIQRMLRKLGSSY